MRRLIDIVSKSDSNRVLTENKDERKSAVNDATATAERMIERYRDSKYTAHERAGDHAMSYDRDHPHQKFWIDVQNEIKRIKNKQKDVMEGSEDTLWRVERSEATGRYYVVKGYNKSRKIWKNKMGVGDFVDQKSAESKADELNKRVTEAKSPEEFINQLKALDRKQPRITNTCRVCGKKWQLQHHCKGPSKNQDKDVPLIFKTLDLKNSQIEEYTKKYFECYNIDQPHGKFISNIKRLSKINESTETKEIASFINMLHQIDSKKKIKIGDKFAVLEFEIIFAYKEINGRGFVTPKEVEEIKLHSDGKINYIKFTDGDRYPRLTPARYEGKPVTYAAYFANKNYAQQALSAITLAVPDEWDLDISDINQESMTEEKLITQHKPGKCTQCGGPSYDDEQLAEEKDACYYKVKSRYRVWPSAYGSGALVKCRRVGAKNWGNKSKKK